MHVLKYRPLTVMGTPPPVATLVLPNALAEKGLEPMGVLPLKTTTLGGLHRTYEYLANRYAGRRGMTPDEVRFAPWYGLRAPCLNTPAPTIPFGASLFQQALATLLNRNPAATLGDLKRYIETRNSGLN
jgi:hypothetical protein